MIYLAQWQINLFSILLLPPAAKLGQGNIFRSVCQEFCPRGGGCAWRGGVRQGGMHGGGGACMAGGHMHGRGVHAWQGVCMAGGYVWQGGMHGMGACVAGGMHSWYYETRSISGRYASYWNAFLLSFVFSLVALVGLFCFPLLFFHNLSNTQFIFCVRVCSHVTFFSPCPFFTP